MLKVAAEINTPSTQPHSLSARRPAAARTRRPQPAPTPATASGCRPNSSNA